MKYNTYNYLYPPRPEKAIPFSLINFYEKRNWVAEVKKNGTSNIIHIGDNNIITKTRHDTDHKLWQPNQDSIRSFIQFLNGNYFVFCAELLHSKIKDGQKNTNYIHDILVYNGEYLINETWQARHDILMNLFKIEDETYSHYIVNENTWIAKPYTNNLTDLYHSLVNIEDEGLVLKNPTAKLNLCSKIDSNSNWQVKCRKVSKNYGF